MIDCSEMAENSVTGTTSEDNPKLSTSTDSNSAVDINIAPPVANSTEETSTDCKTSMDAKVNQTVYVGLKKHLKQAVPLLLLMAINLFYQYTLYIVLFMGLILVFNRSNDIVVKQSSMLNRRSVNVLLFLLVYILTNVVLALPSLENFWLCNFYQLRLWLKIPTAFWRVVFDVAVMDFIIKFITVSIKCCVCLPNTSLLSSEKRGGIFIFIEGLSQLVRCVMPVPEWFKYIVTSDYCIATIICWCFALLYVAIKVTTVQSKFNLIKNGWRMWRFPEIIGTPVNNDDVSHLPRKICPICHGKYVEAMKISCGHVFCHDCCQMYFDRDPNCPVCSSDAIFSVLLGRSQQIPPPVRVTSRNAPWKTGATEFITQLF